MDDEKILAQLLVGLSECRRRIERLERRQLILNITVCLLAIFGVGLAFRFMDIVHSMSEVAGMLKFVAEKVDVVCQSLHGID